MHQDWIFTNVGQRVLSYALDPRPVWFWNEDGSELIWRNLAAKLFRSKFKKKGLKFLPDPKPLKGQVNRLIKLGHDGRASVSRMRFQMGKKPVSATCSCIPLKTDQGDNGLLVISTDAIDFSQFDGDAFALVADEQMFSPAQTYVIINAENEIVAGATADESAVDLQRLLDSSFVQLNEASQLDVSLKAGASMLMLDFAALSEAWKAEAEDDVSPALSDQEIDHLEATDAAPHAEPETVDNDDVQAAAVEDAERPTTEDGQNEQRTSDNVVSAAQDVSTISIDAEPEELSDDEYDIEHLAELDGTAEETQSADDSVEDDGQGADEIETAPTGLTDLIDHLYSSDNNITADTLADTDLLAANRIDANEEFDAPTDEAETDELSDQLQQLHEVKNQPLDDVRNELAELDDGLAESEQTQTFWSISATHIEREVDPATQKLSEEVADKTSKYNFDELSRILLERVNTEEGSKDTTKPETPAREPGTVVAMKPTPQRDLNGKSSLVSLSDEALVLNKLPLGILIFRDQDVLFANRSMADLAGYNTTNDLRDAGLDAILPRAEDSSGEFGPIAKIQRQDGETVDVAARLQTTVWQGQNAYMLTAREEQSSRANNGIIAQARDDAQVSFAKIAMSIGAGYIQLNRAGYVLELDDEGSRIFGPSIDLLRNRPILEYVSTDTRGAYLNILSGETDSGTIKAFAGAEHCEIKLFLGDIEDTSSPIFGFVSAHKPDQAQIDHQKDELNSVLPILSREIRRPLASISGFNSLMKDEAYGPIENDRYKEYIGDIHSATRQIEKVISEIDDLSRLNIGDVELATQEIDLGLLLNRCIVRIRSQANAQQVFVRSAIPETSYFVEADEKLLTQTIMNLLASAVTLTPAGGNVVLSAVRDDDDNLMIHVRDMGEQGQDRAEQFIVYHEPEGDEAVPADFVRSGVGLSLTHALAKANAFSLSLDHIGRNGMLMELAIPADRVFGTTN